MSKNVYRSIIMTLIAVSFCGGTFTAFTFFLAWRLAVIQVSPSADLWPFVALCWFICASIAGGFITLGWAIVRPGDFLPPPCDAEPAN